MTVDRAAIIGAQVAAAAALVFQHHDPFALTKHHECLRLVVHVDAVLVDPAHEVRRRLAGVLDDALDVRVGERQERVFAAVAALSAAELQILLARGHCPRLLSQTRASVESGTSTCCERYCQGAMPLKSLPLSHTGSGL